MPNYLKKPIVSLPCVADRHASENERIVEVTHRDSGAGCLISIRAISDGTLDISVYRADVGVQVSFDPISRTKIG